MAPLVVEALLLWCRTIVGGGGAVEDDGFAAFDVSDDNCGGGLRFA